MVQMANNKYILWSKCEGEFPPVRGVWSGHTYSKWWDVVLPQVVWCEWSDVVGCHVVGCRL